MNETRRGPWWRNCGVCLGLSISLELSRIRPRMAWDECTGCMAKVPWADWPDNAVEEDGDIYLIHDPPTNGLADVFNVEPYRYASANPGNGWMRWTIDYCTPIGGRGGYLWMHTWDDGQKHPRKVVNEMAGYRDPAVVEVAA